MGQIKTVEDFYNNYLDTIKLMGLTPEGYYVAVYQSEWRNIVAWFCGGRKYNHVTANRYGYYFPTLNQANHFRFLFRVREVSYI